jgi:hypothetical protein
MLRAAKATIDFMIACIGWGSLIWNLDGLPIEGGWYEDGPLLRIEFARQSSRGRATLVLVDVGAQVQTLWARMLTSDISEARDRLREREGAAVRFIASQTRSTAPLGSAVHSEVHRWLQTSPADAAVWTALPPKWDGVEGRLPTETELLAYLSSRVGTEAIEAEEYVRRAPHQVSTPYRAAIERSLGWTPAYGH